MTIKDVFNLFFITIKEHNIKYVLKLFIYESRILLLQKIIFFYFSLVKDLFFINNFSFTFQLK